MKANEISFGKTVSLDEAESLIVNVTENRFHLMGEPGIGKSAMLRRIASKLGIDYAYIDVPNMDLGDIAMPVVDHETRTTRYYPNSRFKFHLGKPVAVMLDEFTKGADPVKNMLHPLFEVNNPRLGDVAVPEGSPIFSTGNMSSDGVGDNMNVTPRTLELASNLVNKRDKYTPDALIASLTGVIGEAGARDLQAFIAYSDQLPTKAAIIADPNNAPIPHMPGACAVLVYSMIAGAERDTFSKFMTYIKRLSAEWQATFAINIAKDSRKQAVAFSNADFGKWVADNQDLL